ncbi:cell wall anchor protein [Listeria sp. PSOL-1]|uniref:cell wall anchor protein n=1 Tax=Listeria sp. PSOL-1 TaxID=1844999 RepID=UPI0013D09479|nr:cell wall anchor protein [Listeria sp. PSOL-1]
MKNISKMLCSSLVLSVSLVLPTSVFAETTNSGEKTNTISQELPEPEKANKTTATAKLQNQEAKPLATAKTNLRIEIKTKVNPALFVNAEAGVKLTFKTKPIVSSLGRQNVTILAINATRSEEITVNYAVQDTQKPKIKLIDKVNILSLGEERYAGEFVNVSDNSDNYDIFFAHREPHLDTSKVGKFSVDIIVRDKSGNETEITLNYEVIDETDFLDLEFNYSAPTIDKAKSTATNIYGKTRPNTVVAVIHAKSEKLLAKTLATDNGNFHLNLKRKPLKKKQLVYIQSIDLEQEEISAIAEYSYNGKNATAKRPTTNKVTTASFKKKPTFTQLPKTGDRHHPESIGLGLLVTALYLKKRS